MAYKLVLLLVACFLAVVGCADEDVATFGLVEDEIAQLEDIMNFHLANAARALEDANIFARAGVATVTVTETVCGPDGATSPVISIPETTLVTETSQESPAPTTVQPPASSENDTTSSVDPTSASATPTSLTGETTTTKTSSSSSADGNGAPTGTSDAPTSTVEPPVNAGYAKGETHTLILALALTIVQLLEV
ncbi:hypothetical protein BJY04DRAFT_161276 [Aspergillus karnatakaensis]|uniref:uncharacterized protein n=1 Tax=Aspergillus karnatakaensis TaxID=1810916 RepID=UPI003CCD069D